MFETALITALLSLQTITDLVGTRIVWGTAPVSWARPFLTLSVIGEERIESSDGPTGTSFKNVQIDCVADTELSAITTKNAVLSAFGNYSGTISSTGIQVTCLNTCYSRSGVPISGMERSFSVWSLDFRIEHWEA